MFIYIIYICVWYDSGERKKASESAARKTVWYDSGKTDMNPWNLKQLIGGKPLKSNTEADTLQRATCNVWKRVWFHRFNDFHAGNPTEIWSSNSFYPGKLHDLTSSAQNQHSWYQFTTILTYYGLIIPVYQLI